MGECGCASTDPEIRLPGPEGVHYGVEIYGGCDYCSTPAGVVVYRFDDDEAEVWLGHLEPAEFNTYEGINGEIVQPVLNAAALAAELNEWRESEGDDITESEVQRALSGAVWRTQAEWAEMTKVDPQQLPGDQPEEEKP